MARLPRNKDHALLGHAPRDTVVSAGASPCGNSDVDFSDVFGGPLRRSSVGHTRPGPVEPAGGSGGCVGEGAAASRRPRSSSLGEKPVFGVIGSPSRRRRAGDGFFDDVFRAPEPVLSSNAVLSPARLLPPSRDSALPAQLSLSTRPFKGSDYPAYGSHAPDVTQRNEKSMSDVFSTSPVYNAPSSYRRLLQTKDNPKRDTRASFNESALLHRTLHSQYRLLDATGLAGIETNDTESQLKKDTCGPQAYSDHGYFHFSMYKWASIGVTLVRPHNLKERTKTGTKVSRISIKVSKSADCPIGNQRMSEGHEIFHNQCELEDKSQLSGLAAEEYHDIKLTKEMKKIVPASSDTKDIQSDLTDKSDSAETKLNLPMSALDDIDTCSKDGASVPVKAWKPEPRNLPQLLNVYSDKEGDRERIGKRRNKESVVVGYITKMNDANDPANLEQTISKTGKSVKEIHDTLAAWEDKMVGSRVKGKVRDFVKIFNLEPAPKSGSTIENQDRRPITRNETEGRLVDNEALSTPLMRANQNLGIGERPASDRVLSMQKMDDSSSEVKGILSDRIPNTLDTSFCKIEEAYIENIDECLVEELCHNQNEMTEADTQQDEIKKSDAKIREWSKGKEGNIRLLLSTLQYVLWPGSGWKPVPLVDIVEGTSVRRAYQKALLCLHPDKLQQKGAEMHKKYIAEKIFNILQEAWIHFNSVSSL